MESQWGVEDRPTSRSLKEKVYTSSITIAHVCGLEMTALTDIQQEQVCENNWVRRIVWVNRAGKIRIEKMRMEVGVKESFKKNLVTSMLKWAGGVERIGDGKLA